MYRDAKQHNGFNHCQARSENKLDFHFNASLIAINILNLAVKTADSGNTIFLYLINKDQTRDVARIDVSSPGFSFKNGSVECFEATDTGHGNLNVHTTAAVASHSGTNHHLKFAMPENSFVK